MYLVKVLFWASLMARWLIHLPVEETWVQSLSWKDTLEKEKATHSSILEWKIQWMEEPSGLQSLWFQSQTRSSNQTHQQTYYSKYYDSQKLQDQVDTSFNSLV